MGDALSARELSERTGTPAAEIEAWRDRGLLVVGDDGRFPLEAVGRVRLIAHLARRGIPTDDIAAWAATGELDRHLSAIVSPSQGAYTIEEAAERVGLSVDLVRRFADVIDLEEHGGRLLDDEDLDALRCFEPAVAAGLPEHAVIQLARVFWDAMRRVAETQANLFHFHIRRAFAEQGLAPEAIDDAVWKANEQLNPLDEPALLYFHRRALRHAVTDMTALEVAERVGLRAPGGEQELRLAVAFVDLSSFTPLTEAMGDVQAASVLERFAAIVRSAARERDGHVVKQIGDAFMLVFPDACHAVQTVLAIEQACAAEDQFPAIRGGVNAGSALFQGGEYVGATVNAAARLADAAGRHQVLVSPEARREAGDLPGIAFHPLGTRRLKGIADPIEVWEARPTAPAAGPRLVDPVCGMEMAPDEVAVRLSSETGDLAFCSQTCLRRWVARSDQTGA